MDLKNFKIAVEAYKFFSIIFIAPLENELRIKKSILPVRVISSNSGTVMRTHPTTVKIMKKITKIFGLFLKFNYSSYFRIDKISEIRKISKLSDFDLRIDKKFST